MGRRDLELPWALPQARLDSCQISATLSSAQPPCSTLANYSAATTISSRFTPSAKGSCSAGTASALGPSSAASSGQERCKGRLRFALGPDQTEQVEVGSGEVLVIPPGLFHGVEALEDSVVADAFSPIRQDWLDRRDDYLRR